MAASSSWFHHKGPASLDVVTISIGNRTWQAQSAFVECGLSENAELDAANNIDRALAGLSEVPSTDWS